MTILDGKASAESLYTALKENIATKNHTPHLVIILVGDNPASTIYVNKKIKTCEKIGIKTTLIALPATTDEDTLMEHIAQSNSDPAIHGILVQSPLPKPLSFERAVCALDPRKDVDGLHPLNMGRLVSGDPLLIPCTPLGTLTLLEHYGIELRGKHAVIIGRSVLFGKPMGQLLLQKNATVTHCHSATQDIPSLARMADILISATGCEEMVKADWVKPGAVVIDVGITRRKDGTITGDVDFESVKDVASAITPVPGGIGPMTVACLLRNTVTAMDQSPKTASKT